MPAADRSRWPTAARRTWTLAGARCLRLGFCARVESAPPISLASRCRRWPGGPSWRRGPRTARATGRACSPDPPAVSTASGESWTGARARQPFAVGAFFLPREHDALGHATAIIEEVLCARPSRARVRDVPVNLDVLGAGPRLVPHIRQASSPPRPIPNRRRGNAPSMSRAAPSSAASPDAGPGLEPFFVSSLSCRTLAVQGAAHRHSARRLLPRHRVLDYETAMAIFHQRYRPTGRRAAASRSRSAGSPTQRCDPTYDRVVGRASPRRNGCASGQLDVVLSSSAGERSPSPSRSRGREVGEEAGELSAVSSALYTSVRHEREDTKNGSRPGPRRRAALEVRRARHRGSVPTPSIRY